MGMAGIQLSTAQKASQGKQKTEIDFEQRLLLLT